jgi:hypothetical protein
MPEFPVVIHEEYNTYTLMQTTLGWRLSAVSSGQFQVTIHTMDGRGITRLNNDHVGYFNLPLYQLYSRNPGGLINRDLTLEGLGYTWVGYIINGQRWVEALDEAQNLIATGEIPVDTEGTPYEICDLCELPLALHGTYFHFNCIDCGEIALSLTGQTIEVDGELYGFCPDCEGQDFQDYIDFVTCYVCQEYSTDTQRVRYDNVGEIDICSPCLEYSFWCEDGEHYVHEDNSYYNEDNDDYSCESCMRSMSSPRRYILNWDYRPELIFHPDIPTNPAKPIYIGLELEMSWPRSGNSHDATAWLKKINDEYDDLLYAKSDSSVTSGWEVVTHPMEPTWALENFPFDLFEEAINLGAYREHDSTGTHIHLDKSSMSSAQLWKMLQVHVKLADLCGTAGGRGTRASYASWGNMTEIEDSLKEIAIQKGKAFGGVQRYVPVNVQNEQTIEFRYMAGSIDPEMIRKNIQWIQALYDFTDYISMDDIKEGVLNEPGYLVGWVLNGNYPSIANYLKTKILMPATMPERTR